MLLCSYCSCSNNLLLRATIFVHADLVGYADNNGNVFHRDLECGRQYICWAGTSCFNILFNTILRTSLFELLCLYLWISAEKIKCFLYIRQKHRCWSAPIWRIWPNQRSMLLWLVDLPQLRAVLWGHSSHLGWDKTFNINLFSYLHNVSYPIQKHTIKT